MNLKLSTQRPASLTLRVTAYIGVAITLAFLTFGWIIERSIELHFAEQDADELRGVTQTLQPLLFSQTSHEDSAALRRRLTSPLANHHHGVFFQVTDASGQLMYATPGPDLSKLADTIAPAQSVDAASLHTWQDKGDQHSYRGAVVNLRRDSQTSANPYQVVVAMSMDFHLHYLNQFQRTLWINTLAASVMAILASWLAVYQGHAPIRRISTNIRQITANQLHVRLMPAQVPIELLELATSFNNMLGRIEDAYQRLSNFSADIAHELRTPVTNLTTQTQVALSKARNTEEYREILYSNLEEYERMTKMITDMLFLAQADNGLLKPENTEVNLVAEVQGLFDYFEAWAEERNVLLKLQGNAPTMRGDRLMLRRALSNLLSNAIRHTPPGQAVNVTLTHDTDTLLIRIENNGTEIPPELLPRLFDRFFRVDPSRQHRGDGAGLGLAIVKSIIDAHGGTVTANSANGKIWFQIDLPAAVITS